MVPLATAAETFLLILESWFLYHDHHGIQDTPTVDQCDKMKHLLETSNVRLRSSLLSSLESAVLMGCWHLHQKMKLRSEQGPLLPSTSRPASLGSSCKCQCHICQCHRGWKPRKPDPGQRPDPGLVQRWADIKVYKNMAEVLEQ